MGFFNFKKKKCEKQTNSLGQSLEKLINGELPFGWYAHYQHIVKPKDTQMVALAMKTQVKDKAERITALENLIQYFYSYKFECQSMGECFEKYFDDTWMHCKNSRCDDFVYIKPYEDELKELNRG